MKEYAFEIYQYEIDVDRANTDEEYGQTIARRVFRELEEEDKPTFTLEPYKMVSSGSLEMEGSDYAALENLFHKYNVNHPAGYTGRSLSTSDVVKLNGKYYYCQPFGWDEISIH